MRTENQEKESLQEEVKGYGGYSSRLQYEMKLEKKKRLRYMILQVTVLLILVAFSTVGCIAIFRGYFYRTASSSDENGAGTIKVPTQQELGEVAREPENILEEVDLSLVTVEAILEDGSSRYGSGFILSQEGYALCSTALFQGIEAKEIRAHTVDGISYAAILEGTVEELGFALLRMDGAFGAEAISVGNFAFIERGETLYAAAPQNLKEFPGTSLSGIVASKNTSIQISLDGTAASVPVMFLDVTPNESLWGCPVVDLTGSAVGFCSHAIQSPYGNLTAVVSIHVVYTIVNDMLSD